MAATSTWFRAAAPSGFIATFYFDKQTGLLTRMVRYANSAVGRVPTQFDYSDYRPVAGVMMPFKWTFGWVSGREDYTLTECSRTRRLTIRSSSGRSHEQIRRVYFFKLRT